jgi:flavin reductase (DIM6/NTAB) family NADH-FMN oxidoreductase RutF
VLWSIPAVLAVLGSTNDDGSAHLMNISWLSPVAKEPFRLSVAIEAGARTRRNLDERPQAAVSLLSLEQRELGRAFVKPELAHEIRDGHEYVVGHQVGRSSGGAPFLSDALAVLAGPVTELANLESHVVFLVEVSDVASTPAVLEGRASSHRAHVLGVADTRMNYAG